MKHTGKFLVFLFILFIFAGLTFSQNMPKLKTRVGGTVQSMLSFAQTNTDTNQVGIGLRRVRVRFYASYGKRIKAFIQYSVKNSKILDARITYMFSPYLNIRIGRFVGAGVKAGALTSHTKIDIVERPVSAQNWAKLTVGNDYRDYGIAFMGEAKGFHYNLTLQNGSGAENVIASHNSSATTHKSGLAISSMFSYTPKNIKGLDLGGYYGIGNKYYNSYNSYSAFLYYQPGPYKLKAEYISVIDKNGPTNITSIGYYLFGGYKIAKDIELLARYEKWNPDNNINNDATNIFTVGSAYSLFPTKWSAAKITVVYVVRSETPSVNNNILYGMFQFVF